MATSQPFATKELSDEQRRVKFMKLLKGVYCGYNLDVEQLLENIPTREDLVTITTFSRTKYLGSRMLTIFEIATECFMDIVREKQKYMKRYKDGKYSTEEIKNDTRVVELDREIQNRDFIVCYIANAAVGKYPSELCK